MWRANMPADQPNMHTPKRVLFYAAGLKIYGLLPYLLNRRVRGQFRSNAHIAAVFPTWERNYTIVPYQQTPEAAAALLDWLYADAGFEWGIAEDWHAALLGANAFNDPPCVFHLANRAVHAGFSTVLRGQPRHGDLLALVPGEPMQGGA